nr:hypothetical protein [Dyadobacter tibetensis]
MTENQRSGNLYPTHGLGPIAQIMDINRDDRMDYLVSMASNDFMLEARAQQLAASEPDFAEFKGKTFRGNMNTTTIRTAKGKTIMLQHDVTSSRVYSRLHLNGGAKGSAQKYPLPVFVNSGLIATGHEWIDEKAFKELEEKYRPEIVKRIGELAKKIGGHGGMAFVMGAYLKMLS